MKSWLLVLALLLHAGVADAARRFVEVGNGRGLDATVVPSLLVDRDGLLWVGSREGLYRYDGYLATAFRPRADDPGSVSDVDIRSLYEARDGSIWVSTNTAGLNRLDRRTGRFTRYRHDSADPTSLSDPSVYGVSEDAQGRIWVGTQRGLNRLDADGRRFTRYLHDPNRGGSLANDWAYALHLGQSGTLWIGTVGGGVDRWDEARGEFVNYLPSALTRGSRQLDDVFTLHEAPDGRLWVGTRGGLVVIEPALAHRTPGRPGRRRGCAAAADRDACRRLRAPVGDEHAARRDRGRPRLRASRRRACSTWAGRRATRPRNRC